MTETKFTKGPWRFDDSAESFGRPAIIAKGAERYSNAGPVCLVMKRHRNYRRNAALIAAAPELYEFVGFFTTFAGQILLKKLGKEGREIYDEAVRLCNKANGEENGK